MNPYASLARSEKAARLIEALDHLDREVNGAPSEPAALATIAEKLSEPRRRSLAMVARVRPPSDATWALVVRVLRRRAAQPTTKGGSR